MTITVLEGQTVADLAIQYLGDAERSTELAALNGISITGLLTPGIQLEVPAADRTKQDMVTLFSNKALAPASREDVNDEFEGIDYWALELDFIVQ